MNDIENASETGGRSGPEDVVAAMRARAAGSRTPLRRAHLAHPGRLPPDLVGTAEDEDPEWTVVAVTRADRLAAHTGGPRRWTTRILGPAAAVDVVLEACRPDTIRPVLFADRVARRRMKTMLTRSRVPDADRAGRVLTWSEALPGRWLMPVLADVCDLAWWAPPGQDTERVDGWLDLHRARAREAGDPQVLWDLFTRARGGFGPPAAVWLRKGVRNEIWGMRYAAMRGRRAAMSSFRSANLAADYWWATAATDPGRHGELLAAGRIGSLEDPLIDATRLTAPMGAMFTARDGATIDILDASGATVAKGKFAGFSLNPAGRMVGTIDLPTRKAAHIGEVIAGLARAGEAMFVVAEPFGVRPAPARPDPAAWMPAPDAAPAGARGRAGRR